MKHRNRGSRPMNRPTPKGARLKIQHCKLCNHHYVDVGGGHTCPDTVYVDPRQDRAKGWKQARYKKKMGQ